MVDLFQILLHLNQLTELTEDELKAADVNEDGSVDILDVVALLGHLVGRASLPPCN